MLQFGDEDSNRGVLLSKESKPNILGNDQRCGGHFSSGLYDAMVMYIMQQLQIMMKLIIQCGPTLPRKVAGGASVLRCRGVLLPEAVWPAVPLLLCASRDSTCFCFKIVMLCHLVLSSGWRSQLCGVSWSL